MTAQNGKRPTVTTQPSMPSRHRARQSSVYGSAKAGGAAITRTQCPQARAARGSGGLFDGARKASVGGRTLLGARRIAATALVASLIAGGGLASSAWATPTAPA